MRAVLSVCSLRHPVLFQGRVGVSKYFLKKESITITTKSFHPRIAPSLSVLGNRKFYSANATKMGKQKSKKETSSSMSNSRTGGKAGSRIIWIDLELTGLEDHGKIMEIACLVTDPNLEPIGEGVDVVVHHPDEVLNSMNAWCTENHGKTGLTEACRKSTVTIEEAEKLVLDYVKDLTPAGKCPIAGNSVHTDRIYLQKQMPLFNAHAHYRIIDVSSIKELCRRWYPGDFSRCPPKQLKHRALEDIKESIEELKYYRGTIFVSESEKEERKKRAMAADVAHEQS